MRDACRPSRSPSVTSHLGQRSTDRSKVKSRVRLLSERLDNHTESECACMTRKQHPPTARQRLVIKLLADGWSNKEIGALIGVTEAGAKKHVEALMRRYGVNRRSAVVRSALERGDLRIRRPANGRCQG